MFDGEVPAVVVANVKPPVVNNEVEVNVPPQDIKVKAVVELPEPKPRKIKRNADGDITGIE